jgi:hypothetical protein
MILAGVVYALAGVGAYMLTGTVVVLVLSRISPPPTPQLRRFAIVAWPATVALLALFLVREILQRMVRDE